MDFQSFQAHLSRKSSCKFSENISAIPDDRLPAGQAGNRTSQAILTFVGY